MSFKEYLNEAKVQKEFDDSIDATDFMDKLGFMINSPALLDWAGHTGPKAKKIIKNIVSAWSDFDKEIENFSQ
jgi:hypothetical protein